MPGIASEMGKMNQVCGQPPLEDNKKSKEAIMSWRALFNFTDRAHLIILIPALSLSAVSGILPAALAIFLGKYFDALANFGAGTINDHELVQKIQINTYGLIAIGGATWLMKGGFFTQWLIFGEIQAKSVRDILFQCLLQKDLEWFEMRSTGVGSLLSRSQTQIRELQIGTSQPLGFCINYIVQAVSSLCVCFFYSWKITLVTLAGIPLSAIGLFILASQMQSSIIGQELEMAKASNFAINALSSIDTVKCFNGQDFELRQYVCAIRKAATFYLKQALNNGIQIGLVRFVLTSMFVQGFWYGSYLVRKGNSSSGTVVTTFWSCLMATRAWEDILPHLNVLEKGRAAAIMLKDILDEVEDSGEIAKTATGIAPKFCDGDIEVREVSFAYPSRPDYTVLHKSTLFFPAGETTFVVGKSGSGKSTLGNILMRFYPLSTGQVFIDRTEIRDLDINWLRNNITLVPQSVTLFNETIMRNIAFGQRDFRSVTIEQLKACIELAALQNAICEMPEGIETMVGTGGNALSGGQKQRIAIARARLRDTPILILDESTSALDYISRTSLMNAIRRWRRGKTTVVITHDMGQIEDGDFVYVLDKGRVVEEGYRHSLAGSGKKGLFSAQPKLPQSSLPSQFDFGLGPERALTQVRKLGTYLETIANPHLFTEEEDPLDMYLDSVAEGSADCPQPMSLDRHNEAGETISPSPSGAKASTSAIRGQSRIQGTSLFPQNHPAQQDPDLLRQTGRKAGGGGTRPMSMHQAIVMRSMYRQLSVPSRSQTSSPLAAKRQALPHSIVDRSSLTQQGQAKSSLKTILKTLWPSLDSKNRVILSFGFAAVVLHAVAIPAFAYIFSLLLGTFFIKERQAQKALGYSILILAVAIVDGVACFLSWYLLEAVGEAWVDRLRIEAMARVLDQPKAWYDTGANSVSHITSSLDRNAEEMRNLVGRFMGFVVAAAVMMLIAIIWALITCWKLTLVGLTAVPLIYGVTRSYEAVSSQWEGRTNDASDAAETTFTEAFGDILNVRALTLESYFHKKHTRATSRALTVGIRRAMICGFAFGCSDATIHFVTALIFWYGGNVVRLHDFSIKAVLIVFTMLLSSTSNVAAAIAFMPQISSSKDNASRLLRLARLPLRTSHEHAGRLKLNPQDSKALSGPIEISHLTFSYPSRPGALALSDLNLIIRSGQCIAIVGPSGSGKSTIASLLLGLYPPAIGQDSLGSSGTPSITLSGHNIRSLHLPTLRSMISIVPQTPTLFPTSVRANITYGLELNSGLTSIANVEHAARRAGIHDFIVSLPRGYETVVGDGGLGLSGGQVQRIVIARALCRRPKILILDEATSALDGESAWVVRKSVSELVRDESGMTVIIITHSRDMMQCADHVVVLEQGRVAEEGEFRELLARRGKLWEMLRVGGVSEEGP